MPLKKLVFVSLLANIAAIGIAGILASRNSIPVPVSQPQPATLEEPAPSPANNAKVPLKTERAAGSVRPGELESTADRTPPGIPRSVAPAAGTAAATAADPTPAADAAPIMSAGDAPQRMQFEPTTSPRLSWRSSRAIAARSLEDRPVSIPLAFQPGTTGKRMDEPESAMLDQLKLGFIDAVGNTQDPSSADYRHRWQAAQESSDARFRAQFGDAAFLQKQLELLHPPANVSGQ